MVDKGFAIRCPHCFGWNIWPDKNPEHIVISSKDEPARILEELHQAVLRREVDSLSHPKLFRCKSPRWLCPTSYEAFICRNEKDAIDFLSVLEPWVPKRSFRLYKPDCLNRWDKYYGIMFCTQTVVPQYSFELEQLIDREILSRTILGMAAEINLPLTVYAANIFEQTGKEPGVYWMPIEAYSTSQTIVPSRYNEFCQSCRHIVIEKLVNKFVAHNVSPSNCPVGYGEKGKCAGRDAACLEEPQDWNHCPAFMKERQQKCPCYKSDLELIEETRQAWLARKSIDYGVSHKCYAGFREIMFPIIVHERLVGVAMTGQIFSDPNEIAEVYQVVKKSNLLRGHEDELKAIMALLIHRECESETRNELRFFLTEDELQRRMLCLIPNIQRLDDVANSRYRDIRNRAEYAFRDEILRFVQNYRLDHHFFDTHILHVLKRMREFWAFDGVYLLRCSRKTSDISVVALSTKHNEKSFGVPGKREGSLEIEQFEMHPISYLYCRSQSPEIGNPLFAGLLMVLQKATDSSDLAIPEGDSYFLVAIPFLEEIYSFLFAVRNEKALQGLECCVPGTISHLTQEVILATCTEILHEVIGMRILVEEQKRRETALARLTHELKVPLVAIRGAAEFIKRTAGVKFDHDYAGEISSWSEFMGRLIDNADIFRYSQERMQIKPDRVSILADIIAPAVRQVTLLLQEREFSVTSIELKGLEKLPKLWLDRNQFRLVVFNILFNSIKYAHKDPRIFKVQIEGIGCETEFVILFRDWGLGIEPGLEESIFNEGVRGKNAVQQSVTGDGLGLWIVRQIVQKHGSQIKVSSLRTPTEFRISMPHSLAIRPPSILNGR